MTVPEYSIHYVEIITADVDAVRKVYEKGFGINFRTKGPVLGNAYVASLPAGLMWEIRAAMHNSENPIVRTYLRVNNFKTSFQMATLLGKPASPPGAGADQGGPEDFKKALAFSSKHGK